MKSVQKRGVTILMIVSRNSHRIEAFFLKILENTRPPWRGTFLFVGCFNAACYTQKTAKQYRYHAVGRWQRYRVKACEPERGTDPVVTETTIRALDT